MPGVLMEGRYEIEGRPMYGIVTVGASVGLGGIGERSKLILDERPASTENRARRPAPAPPPIPPMLCLGFASVSFLAWLGTSTDTFTSPLSGMGGILDDIL